MSDDSKSKELESLSKQLRKHELPVPSDSDWVAASVVTETDAYEKPRIEHLLEQNSDLRANRRMRIGYAGAIYGFAFYWSYQVFQIVWAQGLKTDGFALAEKTLDLLIGTALISVLGLVYGIVKSLFKVTKP